MFTKQKKDCVISLLYPCSLCHRVLNTRPRGEPLFVLIVIKDPNILALFDCLPQISPVEGPLEFDQQMAMKIIFYVLI